MQRIEGLLAQGVIDGVYPSAVAAVGIRDRLIGTLAVGDTTLDTRYDLASMTKILAPTMLGLRALEQGRLSLYDPLSLYLDAPADKAGLTILQLMTHTAGFVPSFPVYLHTDSPEKALDVILAQPLVAPPDGTPRYTCMGYIVFGKVLEQLYGAPLDVLARDQVFTPLGMTRTGYLPQEGPFAPTEVNPVTGIPWQGVVHDENARFLGGVSANAGVFADVGDLVRYATMLACQGQGYLHPTTLRKAIRNYTRGHDVHRGLGFHLAGGPACYFGDLFPDASFGHTGFTGTSLAVDPLTGLYAILLTNRVYPTRTNEKLIRFRRVFHNAVYAAFT